MSFGIDNSFFEEFDVLFHEMLHQQGSQLMRFVQFEQVIGAVKYLRQTAVGDAHFVTDIGSITEYTQVKFDRRKLEPKPFECPIMLDKYKYGHAGHSGRGSAGKTSCGFLRNFD
jgi:hypothetical protein